MEEINNLSLLNVDFQEFNFKHRPLKQGEKPTIQINQEYKFQGPTASNKLLCMIDTTINGSDESFELVLHTVCVFDIKDRTKYNESYNELMIQLCYPYIRNKIISLTSEPFASPIILPLKVENISKKQTLSNQIS